MSCHIFLFSLLSRLPCRFPVMRHRSHTGHCDLLALLGLCSGALPSPRVVLREKKNLNKEQCIYHSPLCCKIPRKKVHSQKSVSLFQPVFQNHQLLTGLLLFIDVELSRPFQLFFSFHSLTQNLVRTLIVATECGLLGVLQKSGVDLQSSKYVCQSAFWARGYQCCYGQNLGIRTPVVQLWRQANAQCPWGEQGPFSYWETYSRQRTVTKEDTLSFTRSCPIELIFEKLLKFQLTYGNYVFSS